MKTAHEARLLPDDLAKLFEFRQGVLKPISVRINKEQRDRFEALWEQMGCPNRSQLLRLVFDRGVESAATAMGLDLR